MTKKEWIERFTWIADAAGKEEISYEDGVLRFEAIGLTNIQAVMEVRRALALEERIKALAEMTTPSMSERPDFDEWIRQLDEDVLQGMACYGPGEFTVYPEVWRPMYDDGLTPTEAYEKALSFHTAKP